MDRRRRSRLRACLDSGRLVNFKELEILSNELSGIQLDTNSVRFSTTGMNSRVSSPKAHCANRRLPESYSTRYLTDAFAGEMVILVSFLIVEIGFERRFFAREIANRVKQSLKGGSPLAV